MAKKQRLDLLINQKYPHLTRNQIQSFIMQGKVRVDEKVVLKPGTPTAEDALIELDQTEPKFVCRAGFKLEAALDQFNLDVHGLVALDAGISTGGFTDCLLQRGATKVYGIDVGYGQVHEKIRQDIRVDVRERTNLRHLTTVGALVDLVTLDLSFISVLKVMDAVLAVLKPGGKLVVLIKPQFEAEKDQVGKGGIIRDAAIHEEVIHKVTEGIKDRGFLLQGVIESPLTGTDGNKEFLAYFVKS